MSILFSSVAHLLPVAESLRNPSLLEGFGHALISFAVAFFEELLTLSPDQAEGEAELNQLVSLLDRAVSLLIS